MGLDKVERSLDYELYDHDGGMGVWRMHCWRWGYILENTVQIGGRCNPLLEIYEIVWVEGIIICAVPILVSCGYPTCWQ